MATNIDSMTGQESIDYVKQKDNRSRCQYQFYRY